MTPNQRPLVLLMTAACALAALPGTARAQRCRVSEIEVPAVTVRVGAREQLLIIFRDAQGIPCNEDPAYTATSNNTAVARVDHGYVLGVAAGQAVITIASGTGRLRKTGSGAITVTAEAPANQPGGAIAPPPLTPQPQAVQNVPVNARGAGAATLAYQPAGTAPAVGILTDPERLQLLPGERRFLRYRTSDITGGNAQPLPMQFAVEPSAALLVFQVDSIGIVTAADTGRGTIRVTAVGAPNVRPAIVPVEVRRDSVRFARRLVNMAPGSTDTVRLHVVAQNRDLDFGQVYQYASSDTTIVKVHIFEPVLEARRPGVVTVTASNPLLPPVVTTVNVFRPVAAIQAPDTSITIAIRQVRRAVMRPVASDSSFVHEAPYALLGLDTTKVQARYDSAAGALTLTGRASGRTAITMRVQNGRDSSTAVSRTLRVNVVAGGLAISSTRVGLGIGDRAPITLALLDDARRPIAGVAPEVTWTSSDTNVAKVEGGQIVARGVGHAHLVARTPWDSTAGVDAIVGPGELVVKQRGGQWNVFGASGADPARLTWSQITSDSLVESFPTWSPDLTRIAYVVRPAGRPRGGDLWVANADGSGAHRLFGLDSAVIYRPQFVRPAGDEIVFELSYLSNNRSEIWTIDIDGRNARRLPVGPPNVFVGSPNVSPDGRRILYVSLRQGSGGYDIYLSGMDGSGERRLTTWQRNDEQPVWAPDGQSFFFLRDEGDVNRQPAAAPQPGAMVFTRGGKAPSKAVFRFDLRTDSATRVTQAGWFITAFGVSGDGAHLTVNVLQQDPPATMLAIADVATGEMVQVPLDAGEILAQASPAAPRPPAAPAVSALPANPSVAPTTAAPQRP